MEMIFRRMDDVGNNLQVIVVVMDNDDRNTAEFADEFNRVAAQNMISTDHVLGKCSIGFQMEIRHL